MNMHAHFTQQSQHFQLNNDYYTHYFLYYAYYFQCLCRIELLVTSTYALQADIQRIYERYHATASRRKLSLLSHWPSLCPFLLYYSHYITIISLLYVLFQNWKRRLGVYSLQKTCQSAHPPQGISEHTNQEHQGLNHQAPKRLLPRCQMQQPAHPDRSCRCTQANPHAIQV